MIKITDFTKWFQGVKYVFNLACTECKVMFYNEHLFTTTDIGAINQLKTNPEQYMKLYFKDKFSIRY